MNEILKESMIELKVSESRQPLTNTQVTFFTYDVDSALLKVKLLQRGGEILDLENLDHITVILRDGRLGSRLYLKIHERDIDTVNGIITLRIENNLWGFDSEIHGFVYVRWHNGSSADVGGFIGRLRHSHIDTDVESLEFYVREFEDLRREILRRAEEVERALQNLLGSIEDIDPELISFVTHPQLEAALAGKADLNHTHFKSDIVELDQTLQELSDEIESVDSTLQNMLENIEDFRGEQGEQGIPGERGERGEQGLLGERGESGERGERGERGEQGLPGQDGKDGQDGRDGVDGTAGERGLQGEPGLHGERGERGEQGVQGAQGTAGRGITSTAITYQVHTSGTTAPTGTWLAAVPATTAGQFLWTRTILTFSDSTTTTLFAVSRNGTDGSSANLSNMLPLADQATAAVGTGTTAARDTHQHPHSFPYGNRPLMTLTNLAAAPNTYPDFAAMGLGELRAFTASAAVSNADSLWNNVTFGQVVKLAANRALILAYRSSPTSTHPHYHQWKKFTDTAWTGWFPSSPSGNVALATAAPLADQAAAVVGNGTTAARNNHQHPHSFPYGNRPIQWISNWDFAPTSNAVINAAADGESVRVRADSTATNRPWVNSVVGTITPMTGSGANRHFVVEVYRAAVETTLTQRIARRYFTGANGWTNWIFSQ